MTLKAPPFCRNYVLEKKLKSKKSPKHHQSHKKLAPKPPRTDMKQYLRPFMKRHDI